MANNDDQPHKVRKDVESKRLIYKFTDDELRDLALDLAHKNQEVASIDKEKKSVMSDYKAKQDLIVSEINVLATKISNGQMMREIDCDIQWHHPTDGIKTFTRRDTGYSWEERMLDSEWNLFNGPR